MVGLNGDKNCTTGSAQKQRGNPTVSHTSLQFTLKAHQKTQPFNGIKEQHSRARLLHKGMESQPRNL